jgi:hypothetical protein
MVSIKNHKITVLVIAVMALFFLASLPVSADSLSVWNSMNSGTTGDLNAIWGVNATDVFAVGSSGTVIRYNGTAWTAMNSGTTGDLNAIWGVNATDVFAVGSSGTVIRYNGTAWTAMNSGTTGDLYDIWGADGSSVFAVGKSGVISFYDGTKFTPMNRSSITDLRTVWGLSSIDVFTAGMSGTILRYLPPFINSVSPDQGFQGSKLDVTITGKNFSAATEVRFGVGIAVNSFTVTSATKITANIEIVAGAKIGARDVSVITPGGIFTLPNGLTVNLALPVIASISPNQDRQGATLNITITGTNLSGTSEVRFGTGIAVNSFTILSGNQVTANITIAADAAVGVRDVSVTTPGGSFTLSTGFTIKQGLPVIASISPNQDRQGATLNVTITGTNLNGTSEVRFGTGIALNSYTVLSGNQLTANITIAPDSTVGTRDISVTTPGGTYVLPASFTVKQALPKIASISPDNGNQGATLTITIKGINFSGASEVRFGTGMAVNNMSVLNSSQIEVMITIIAGTETGAKNVSITTPGGSYTLANGFTVIQSLPVITSISPENASQGTSLAVTISGSNLEGASSVSFGTGTTVINFTNLSPTQLLVNVLIHSDAVMGLRDISVTTPGGSTTLSNRFNVKGRSLSTVILALIWVGVAVVGTLLLFILNKLRQKRAVRF